jgi:hypothetical protein
MVKSQYFGLNKTNLEEFCILHVFFKGIALLLYFLFPMFVRDNTFSNVTILLLMASDFWVVKNISGRKLLGLRYWVETDFNGNDQWYFECKLDECEGNSYDEKFFWLTQILAFTLWSFFAFISFLSSDFKSLVG